MFRLLKFYLNFHFIYMIKLLHFGLQLITKLSVEVNARKDGFDVFNKPRLKEV